MLAGYEDRPHLIPASGRPPCGSVSAAGRRLYIAPACGRASVPYPGVRPRKRGRPAHALLACAAGLRPHLIPASGRPPCGSVGAAGRRLYIAPACGRASAASLRPYLIPASAAAVQARPACGRTLSRRASVQARPACGRTLSRPCERGRPAAVHFPGRRRPAASLHALLYRSLGPLF